MSKIQSGLASSEFRFKSCQVRKRGNSGIHNLFSVSQSRLLAIDAPLRGRDHFR